MNKRVMPCLNCDAWIEFGREYCEKCGSRIGEAGRPVRPCLHCDALVDSSVTYCPECHQLTIAVEGEGVPLEHAGEPTASRSSFGVDQTLVGLAAIVSTLVILGSVVWVVVWG